MAFITTSDLDWANISSQIDSVNLNNDDNGIIEKCMLL